MAENRNRGRGGPEFELIQTLRDAFMANRYFDVFIEYTKAGPEDILCRISASNHILPHLWFRNTWSWGYNSDHLEMYAVDRGVYTRHRHVVISTTTLQ